MVQWREKVIFMYVKLCCLAPRSIVLALKWSQKQPKFQKLSWWVCPQTAQLLHANAYHFKSDGYSASRHVCITS